MSFFWRPHSDVRKVPLPDGAGEDGGDELLHLRGERRGAGADELDLAAEGLRNLVGLTVGW